jgi:DNA-binding NarL/FixJ family response regulator
VRKTQRKLRVLVADDNELLRETIVKHLADRFEIVAAVCNGRELVDAALTHKADVIVSDASMPALTGAEALRLLRSSGQSVPFVLLTADVCWARGWCELGMLAVVDKRDLHDELVAAVESAAAGMKYLSRHAKKL